MIQAWILDYRHLTHSLASTASSEAVTLLPKLRKAISATNERDSESIVLATCHRYEIYTYKVSSATVDNVLRECLSAQICKIIEKIDDISVARHLMRVTAGMESMIIGETDVQRQVVVALTEASELGTAGPMLSNLFRTAIHAGKQVRSLTTIGRHTTSIAPAAVDLLATRLGSMNHLNALVFGAGSVAHGVCKRLLAVGIGHLSITNRTFERADQMSQTYKADPVQWEMAGTTLKSIDIAITATASPKPFIDTGMLSVAIHNRSERPLHIIDLAVPQNVSPDAINMNGIVYYDMAEIEMNTRKNREARAVELPHAQIIVDRELDRFRSSLLQLKIAPTLSVLGEFATATRDRELERIWRRLPKLSQREKQVIESLAHNLSLSLVRRPMKRLREIAASNQARNYQDALEYLFSDHTDIQTPKDVTE